ncbi:MAG TPA: hypothetical protein VLH15_00880 [Dehalococcoidales bacterium]|nr:hypothetical protein [Dehalococcoidales bacterium]
MDIGSIVIFIVVIFALFWLVMRLRGNVRNPPKLQMSMEMISALNDDLKFIQRKLNDPADLRMFKIANWKSYQNHLEHIDKEYVDAVKSCFTQMAEYNEKIKQKKIDPGSETPRIDLEELKKLILKARAGLAKWIQENVHREATRGLFSWRH